MSGAVVVVGDVMIDVVVVPEGPIRRGSDRAARIERHPGGSGANQAAWLAALGVPVRLVARVAAADRDGLVAQFAAAGVEARLEADADRPTGTLICLVDAHDGERSFLTDRGANLALGAAELPENLLEGAGLLLVSGYSLFAEEPRRAAMRLMGIARRRGLPVAVDAASAGFLAEMGVAEFLAAASGTTLLFANGEEAALLSGEAEPEAQLRALGAHFAEVVLKRGALGAMLGNRDGVLAEAPAPRVVVLDTTGAGDAFAAGFIAGRLDGAGPQGALLRAVEAGALAVTRRGGRPG